MNYALIKNGGLSKGIIEAMIDYSKQYGYYGGKNILYDENGKEKEKIPFYFSLIRALIDFAPNDKNLLDQFCQASQNGYAILDKNENYVYFRFRNENNFNKHLKANYPECECYVDLEGYRKTFIANNGSLPFVGLEIKKKLKDPDSYDEIGYKILKQHKDKFMVRVQYRAKNSFGGFVVEEIDAWVNIDGEVLKE